jgi:hypothetical protein
MKVMHNVNNLPIVNDTICAPGATPFLSGVSGKYAAAIEATWVPWLAVIQNTMRPFTFPIRSDGFIKKRSERLIPTWSTKCVPCDFVYLIVATVSI